MGDLLGRFRDGISPTLIGEPQWERILECAGKLPITLAALPFGFELPLHTRGPEADFGVSLASGTRPAAYFKERARADRTNRAARAITRLCGQIDAENSSLREIVGRKLMLEYDIGSAPTGESPLPGLFLIPRERPIVATGGREQDAGAVVDALVTSVGWESNDAERETVERIYLAQPENTRIESLGLFPSRPRAIRLAVMGFKSRRTLGSWLQNIGWPGQAAPSSRRSPASENAWKSSKSERISTRCKRAWGRRSALRWSSGRFATRIRNIGSTVEPTGIRYWKPCTARNW